MLMFVDVVFILDVMYYSSALIMLYIGSLMLSFYFKYFRDVEEEEPKELKHYPFVSVVIPLYNDEKNIAYTLSSILTSNYPMEKVEVIVVDDASNDNGHKIAKQFEEFGVKVIRLKENRGAAHAKNVGIKASKGEIVITIDSDSIMDENAIRNFIPYFEDKKVGGVSGAIRTRKPRNLIEYFQFYEYDIILFTRKVLEKIESIPVTPGGMSAFRKSSIMEVGLFDEKSLTEDQEIAFKLQKHNYAVRCSLESFSYTDIPSTFVALIRQRVRWVRGGVYNRIVHKSLFDLRYGDFLIMGFIYDFLFAIPVVTMLVTSILKIGITKPYFLVFKINPIEEFLVSFNFLFFINFFLVFFYLFFTLYMLNFLRKKAGDSRFSLKELPYFFTYVLVYPTLWFLIWAIVIYKEIRREGYKWGTR